MKAIQQAGAIAVGLILGATPFLRYGVGGTHRHGAGPHTDHEPRHGGHVLMVGDYHLEVVDRGTLIELYLSDASRRPLRPTSSSVAFDGGRETSLAWRSYRSVVPKPPDSTTALYHVSVRNGPLLTLKLP